MLQGGLQHEHDYYAHNDEDNEEEHRVKEHGLKTRERKLGPVARGTFQTFQSRHVDPSEYEAHLHGIQLVLNSRG
jgi:hypothetical protein